MVSLAKFVEQKKNIKNSFIYKNKIESWDQNILYGKVHNNFLIIPKDEYLINLNKNVILLDVVLKAFLELKFYFEKEKLFFNSKSSFIKDLIPKNGYENIKKEYEEELKIYFKNKKCSSYVINDMLHGSTEKKVFPSFKKYILKNLASPFLTGLSLDITFDDYSSLDKKNILFVNDPKFEFYRGACEKFGFYLDANVPWRIIFNIFSGGGNLFLKKESLVSENFFEVRYERGREFEEHILNNFIKDIKKTILIQFVINNEFEDLATYEFHKQNIISLLNKDQIEYTKKYIDKIGTNENFLY